ncbi:MAG TPA: DUF4340 domain-containing protein [Burkholderiales bacterium]|jgi:hypothetical protein|nr:DUF4340 domain-containing protein [Burkholderiales bacterium]
MNARAVAILVVLLVVLGGGALLIQQRSAPSAPGSSLGQPLLPGLKASDVAAVAIKTPKDSLTVERKGERWVIAERDGFPADFDKVRDFVIKATGLKIGQVDEAGGKDRARLQLDASGTRIEFRGADGKPLAALVAGKKYFKTEPDNPEKAMGDGRYVALAGDDKRIYLISDPLAQANTKSADWIDHKGFAAEKVKTLEVRYPDGNGSYKIERSGDNADWKFSAGGEKLDAPRANSASYSLSLIELADVAAKDAKPEDTGLDKPTVVTANTFDGLTYTLKVGKLAGENYYATLAIEGEAKPEGKDAAERAKKLAERLPREKSLERYVLLIPKSKLDDTLKKRADLVEKKAEKK